jgi:hypothetical protein
MSDIHRKVLELFQEGVDRGASAQALRAEIQDHLARCAACRMDVEIDQRLRAEAALRWPAALEPQRSAGEMLSAMQAEKDGKMHRQLILKPLRAAAWAALAILLVLGLYWVIANLRPQPAALPIPTRVETATPPPETATPTPGSGEAGFSKTPLEPFATSPDMTGRGLWSPDSKWFFYDLVETGEDPLSDRRVTTINFLDPASGEICQADQTLLGQWSLSNIARWLPGDRLLIVLADQMQPPGERPLRAEDQGAKVYTPCGETLSLDDRFPEAVLSMPFLLNEGTFVALQGETHYWLLDPAALVSHQLDEPLPSSDDRLAWSPSGDQLAIYQPAAPGDQATSGMLTLLDAESGAVVKTIELASGGEVAMIDWLQEDTIYVWTFSEKGPLLVDLAGAAPRVIRVLPDWFGLDLVYPNDFAADASVADESAGTYHIAFKVNTASDHATYLYHSESGEVEKLPVEGSTYLIFPDGDFEPLFLTEDGPTYTDEFDLVWVDDADKGVQHLRVAGHATRNYPILWPRLLSNGSQIAFASSQGVSLVSIPDGKLLSFWSLEGGGDPSGRPALSPDGRFLSVPAWVPDAQPPNPGGLFYMIPLEP